MTFAACIPVILNSEGGYVDDPDDPGGATNFGITEATLASWRGHPVTPDDVREMSVDEAKAIYQANYYNPAHGPDLPAGLDLLAFDAAVNSGVGRAIILLQVAVGSLGDGHYGPNTAAAVARTPIRQAIDNFHDAHAAFYQGRATFWKYGKGWLARNDRTRIIALGMIA